MSALAANLDTVRKSAPGREIIPVIKANAYGHGMTEFAKFMLTSCGIKRFGLARVSECVFLREKLGRKPGLLVLGGFLKQEAETIAEMGFEPSVFSLDEAKALNKASLKAGKKTGVHVKINTGMNRLGIRPGDAGEFIRAIRSMEGLELKGVYTHFYNSDSCDHGEDDTRRQTEMLAAIKHAAGPGVVFHAANSAAVLKYPFSHFDAVRPGIMIYGSYLDGKIRKKSGLRPVMTLKSRVMHSAFIKKGETVSYGATYRAKKDGYIAVVGIGYADGFSRHLSGKWHVLIGGEKAPVLGRVCMDMIVTGTRKKVPVGSETLVLGSDRSGSIAVEDMAEAAGTISYEIFTGISERVERVYKY